MQRPASVFARVVRAWRILVLLPVATLLAVLPAQAAGRVALVIGNSDYQSVGRLNNPVNDATAVSQALGRLDFGVTLVTDASKARFETALADFSEKAEGADIALIYYAGHAMEMNGTNYLIPTDATLKSDNRVAFETVTLDDMLNAIDGVPGLKMVLLDSCRNNPFLADMARRKLGRSIGRGLARVEPPTAGLLISYSAAAGTTADDGEGAHSPYTTALLDNIEKPGLEINMLFRSVAASVKKQTKGDQTPFDYGSLPDEAIYLKPPAAGNDGTSDKPVETASLPDDTVDQAGACDRAAANWQAIENLNDAGLYREHIRLFADCGFASLAKLKLAALEKPAPATAAGETECDRLAANPSDPMRLAGMPGVVTRNISMPAALDACRKAAAEYPDEPRLQYQYGRTLAQNKNYAEAADLYKRAADDGEIAAMHGLGGLHISGPETMRDDAEAMAWFRKAADLGYADSMSNIGLMLQTGRGVKRDIKEARRWYEKGAEAGSVAAMYGIGQIMASTATTPQQSEAAAGWIYSSLRKGSDLSLSEMKTNKAGWNTAFRKAMQQKLRDEGIYDGPVDGKFGSSTFTAMDAIFGKDG